MSYENNIISLNDVSIDDVHSALGESSYDLGTLCKSSKINMFSVHKPTKKKYDFEETYVNSEDRRKEWWQGDEGDYMIDLHPFTIGQLSSSDGEIYNLFNSPSSYKWSLKNIGSDGFTYFRLTDFAGYVDSSRKWSAGGVLDSPVKAEFGSSDGKNLLIGEDLSIGFYVPTYSESDVFTNGGLLTFLQCLGKDTWDAVCLGAVIQIEKSDGSYEYKVCTIPMRGKEANPVFVYGDDGEYKGTAYHYSVYASIAIRIPFDVFNSYKGRPIKIIPIASVNEFSWDGNGNASGYTFAPILPPRYILMSSRTLSEKTAYDTAYTDPTLKILFVRGTKGYSDDWDYSIDQITVQATATGSTSYNKKVSITDVSLLLFRKVNDTYVFATSGSGFRGMVYKNGDVYSKYTYEDSPFGISLSTTTPTNSSGHIFNATNEYRPVANTDGTSPTYAQVYVKGECKFTDNGTTFRTNFSTWIYITLDQLVAGYTNS